ncbi:hypothetical protein [Mycoplasma leonicaptivi]|uniref:hypothetical protein n=1 Tax=Mycoplasma leonicaptivi TaxID=36742 RepID=UPI000481F5ED|nr:hypothetical protein [Mycoplasma leonicaptivi]
MQDKEQANILKQNIVAKQDVTKKSYIDNTTEQLLRLNDLLNKQKQDIQNIQIENSGTISTYPGKLKDKFNNKLDKAGTDLEKLKKLKDELEQYTKAINKAREIHNDYDRENVYDDLYASQLSDLKDILKKIDRIIEDEQQSEFDALKKQVKELNKSVTESEKNAEFANKIDQAQDDETLLDIKKDIEDYLKENSGENALLRAKKEVLLNKLDNSNLSDSIKEKFRKDIQNATDINELSKVEKDLNKLLDFEGLREKVRNDINKINNPKRDELINKLNLAKLDESISELGKMANDILRDAKSKSNSAIDRLAGDYATKNDFELKFVDAKTEQDFKDITVKVKDYLDDLGKKVQEAINKIDTLNDQKAKLQEQFNKLGENATAGDYLNILNKALEIDNFEEAKKNGQQTADLIKDQTKGQELKEKLQNAQTLDDALKIKSEIDRIHEFEVNKELAKKAIESIEHTAEKTKLQAELEKANTSDKLVNIITAANNYKRIESDNKLTHDELKEFIKNNIDDESEKTRLTSLVDNAVVDSNNQANIDQNEIASKLVEARKEINKILSSEQEEKEALRRQKEQLLANINKIRDLDSASNLRDELNFVNSLEEANKLEEKVDLVLELERLKDKLGAKTDKLVDKKEYNKRIESSEEIQGLKDLEKEIDADLEKEARELLVAKNEAQNDIVKLSNSNPLKITLFDELEKAKSPTEVSEIVNKAKALLSDKRQEALDSIDKTVGNDSLNNKLKLDFGGANSEVAYTDIIKEAEKAFGDKKSEVILALGSLRDENPKKPEFREKLIQAKNISELESLLSDVVGATNIDTAREMAQNKLDTVQDETEKANLQEKLTEAPTVEAINSIQAEIEAQLQAEKNEIAANKATVLEKVNNLYKDENKELFTNQANNENITLAESRDLVKNIDTVIALEQDELADKKREAKAEVAKRLKDTLVKRKLDFDINHSPDLKTVDKILEELNIQVQKLRDEAKAEAAKLINNAELNRLIDQANTQIVIDQLKQQAIDRLQTIRLEVKEKNDRIINVSTQTHDVLESRILSAQNETELNALSSEIDTKLVEYNNETQLQLERLVNPNNTLPRQHWVTESESKKVRDHVFAQIDQKWSDYQNELAKLSGDAENHKKYSDILATLDKRYVSESRLDGYIAEMQNIYNLQVAKSRSDLETVGNQTVKGRLKDQLDSAQSISDLLKLQEDIKLQKEKESVIATLPSKIVYEEQRQDFENRINAATSKVVLDALLKEIDAKQNYNNNLAQLKSVANSKNDLIDINNEKRQDFAQVLENARTNEEVARVQAQIEEYLAQKLQEAADAVKQLNGRNEKSTQENNLAGTQTESGMKNIKDRADQLFNTEKQELLSKLPEVKSQEKVTELTSAINSAPDILTLDNLKKDLENQITREQIQAIIDGLQDQTKKAQLQTQLNNAQTTKELADAKQAAQEARKQEIGELASLKEQAEEELKRLLDTNTERARLKSELDTTQEITKVKEIIKGVQTEIDKQKAARKGENGIITKIQARGRDSEAPFHTSKYNELVTANDNAKTEAEIIANVDNAAKSYLESVKTSYTEKINNIPGDSSEKTNIINAISSADTTNKLDEELKKGNDLLKKLAEDVLNTLESETKKSEFTTEINQAHTVGGDKNKFLRVIDDLKVVYDKIKAYKQQEERELQELKTQIRQELNNLNDKTTLEQELNQANTSAAAKVVRDKINAKIQEFKNTAKAVVEKANGVANYNNLKQQLENAQSQNEILDIQNQATQIFNTAKENTQNAINEVDDNTAKQGFTSRKEAATNVSELNRIKSEAEVKAKQEDLLKLIQPLWDKKTYESRINSASSLIRLNAIEAEINRDKRDQDKRLATAKTNAKQYVDKVTTNNEKLNSDLEAATTLDAVKAVENAAKKTLNDKKETAKQKLAKLVGSTSYPRFERTVNTIDSENALDSLITDLDNEFNTIKQNAKTDIASRDFTEKAQVTTELESADTFEKINNLQNAAAVYEKVKVVEDKIKDLRNKEPHQTKLNSIKATRPTNNADKDSKLAELTKLASDVDQALRNEIIELSNAKTAANEVIDKLDVSKDKQTELRNFVASSNDPEAIIKKQEEGQKILDDARKESQAEIDKLTENNNPRNELQAKLNRATLESEIKQIKTEVATNISNKQKDAESAVAKLDGEKTTELNQAKTTNTQKAYDDLINAVETRLNELRNEAKANLNKIKDPQKRADFENQINNATTKNAINAQKDAVELEIAKQDTREEADKLSNTNISKATILNEINSATTKQAIDTAKQKVTEQINQAKQKATEAVAKLEGHTSKVGFDRNLKNATTEDEYNKIFNDATQTFNSVKQDVESQRLELLEGGSEFNLNDKNTVKQLYEANSQIIAKAKEYTKKEIQRLDATKQSELNSQVDRTNSVASINNIRTEAIEKFNADQALAAAKEEAKQWVNKLVNKNDKLNAINNATTISAVNQIRDAAKEELRLKRIELENLKAKFNANNNVLTQNSNPADTIQAIENAITNLNNELARLKTSAETEINRIKVENNLLNGAYANENDDYNRLKQEINSIANNNPTQAKYETINNQINTIVNNRKQQALTKLNQLSDSPRKQTLNTELNSANTRSAIIEIEKKIAREKEVQRLKAKLASVKDASFKNNMNTQLDNLNSNLVDKEREIDNKIAQEAENLRIAKEQALAEITKLPSSEQRNPRQTVERATEQSVVDSEKTKAQARYTQIFNDTVSEINKLPENAHSELNGRLILADSNGDQLVVLKNLASQTVAKSNALQSKIDSTFANSPAHKTHFSNLRNSNSADTIAKIDSISNQIDQVKRELDKVNVAKDSLRQNTRTAWENRINQAFTQPELARIFEDLKIEKAKQDAEDAINSLSTEAQKETLQQDLRRANTVATYNRVKDNAIALKNRIAQGKTVISTIPEANRGALQDELNRADTTAKVGLVEAKVRPIQDALSKANKAIERLQSVNATKRTEFNNLLNNGQQTTVAQIDNITRQVNDYIRQEELRKAREGATELLRRLSNDNFKREKEAIINNDNETISNILSAKQAVKNKLDALESDANNALARLNNDNSVYTQRKALTTNSNTQNDYETTIAKVNEVIEPLRSQAKTLINRLSANTISHENLNSNIDSQSITQSQLETKIARVNEILNLKKSQAQKAIEKLESNDKNRLNSIISNPNVTESELNAVINEAQNKWNQKVAELDNEINKTVNTAKKQEFLNAKSRLTNIEQINAYINSTISNYYEFTQFNPVKSRYTDEDVLVNVKLSRYAQKHNNRTLYLVVNNNGSKVVSSGVRLNSDTVQFRLNKDKFMRDGDYTLDNIVWSDNGNLNDNDVLNSNQKFVNSLSQNNSFNMSIHNIIAENVRVNWIEQNEGESNLSARDLIESSYKYTVEIIGLTSVNLSMDTNSEVRLKFLGTANTGNQVSDPRFKNRSLRHELDIVIPANSLQKSETNNNGNLTLRFNNLSGFKAGYLYKLEFADFAVKDNNNNRSYPRFIYSNNDTYLNDSKYDYYQKAVLRNDSTYNDPQKEARAWALDSGRIKVNIQNSEFAHYGTYTNIDSSWMNFIAFDNGWTTEAFGSLFKYLNSAIPQTGSNYTVGEGTQTGSLRSAWLWKLTELVTNAHWDTRDYGYIKHPANTYYDYKWSVSGIQLGKSASSKRYHNWREGNRDNYKIAPVLGGREVQKLYEQHPEFSIAGNPLGNFMLYEYDGYFREPHKQTLIVMSDQKYGAEYRHRKEPMQRTIQKAINWLASLPSSDYIE